MSMTALGQFIPLILIFVIFYFLLIRPQQKRVSEHKTMISKLTKGDSVITAGGIIGKISRVIDEEKVELEVADNVNVKVIKSTISQVLSKSETK
jgi:preprotein translocase subunit YajC